VIDPETWARAMADYERRPAYATDIDITPRIKRKKKKGSAKKRVERIDSRDSLRSDYMKVLSKPAIPQPRHMYEEIPAIVTRR
jgi:hypothetical protein